MPESIDRPKLLLCPWRRDVSAVPSFLCLSRDLGCSADGLPGAETPTMEAMTTLRNRIGRPIAPRWVSSVGDRPDCLRLAHTFQKCVLWHPPLVLCCGVWLGQRDVGADVHTARHQRRAVQGHIADLMSSPRWSHDHVCEARFRHHG
jgi:hypothetical protein